MRRRVWSLEEIENVLRAANQASEMCLVLPGAQGESVQQYRRGFMAALVTLALAFGLRPADADISLLALPRAGQHRKGMQEEGE